MDLWVAAYELGLGYDAEADDVDASDGYDQEMSTLDASVVERASPEDAEPESAEHHAPR